VGGVVSFTLIFTLYASVSIIQTYYLHITRIDRLDPLLISLLTLTLVPELLSLLLMARTICLVAKIEKDTNQ
jgi:hypothetical protein